MPSGACHVVVDPPVLGEDLGLEEDVELLAVEVLVAHPAVEALDPGVLPGCPGSMKTVPGVVEAAPVGHRVGDELGAVVEADVGRCAAHRRQAFETGDDPIGVDRTLRRRWPALSRVNSSMTLRILSIRPSEVWSNWKSRARAKSKGDRDIS